MRYVKYVGLAHRRIITADEWRGIGMDAQTTVWGPENGFSVPADQFTDNQMRRAIEADDNFVIVGRDDEPEVLPGNVTGDQADAPRVSMTDKRSRNA